MAQLYNPPLQVLGFIGTKPGDTSRGPEIRLNAYEAHVRSVHEGELVWVYGPRRHDLAALRVDDTIPRGGVIAQDIVGLAPSEIVRLVRINTDRPIITPSHA